MDEAVPGSACDFLTVAEAANRLGVPRSAVLMAIHGGDLQAMRFRCPCGHHSGAPRAYLAAADVAAYNAPGGKGKGSKLREVAHGRRES